jgi:hypothetical protein
MLQRFWVEDGYGVRSLSARPGHVGAVGVFDLIIRQDKFALARRMPPLYACGRRLTRQRKCNARLLAL